MILLQQNKKMPRVREKMSRLDDTRTMMHHGNPTKFFELCLLWIDKTRAKDKTYIWVSVRWKTKTQVEESTRLACTVLLGELEYLKMKTRLIDEMFASVMGEYVFLKW